MLHPTSSFKVTWLHSVYSHKRGTDFYMTSLAECAALKQLFPDSQAGYVSTKIDKGHHVAMFCWNVHKALNTMIIHSFLKTGTELYCLQITQFKHLMSIL